MAKCRRTTAHGLSMRSAILFLVLTDVLLSCCATAAASTVTKAGCTDTERDALLAFKAGIVSDPFRNLSSWGNHGGDCCSWSGVVCSNRTGITSAHVHVVRLGLYGAGFFAEKLSPALLSLTRLKVLNIGYNDFGGIRIPEFLGSFKKLRYLDLTYANFQGAIPPQLGNLSTLTFLNLATWPQGQMRADNLGWLLGLPSLTYLDMDGVDLSKASHNWLPIISTLHSLTVLSLYGCDIASLPSSFSHPNLTALTYLRLSYNGFNSTLPSWVWQLTSLSTLYLSYNHFYGTLPSAIGNLTRLEFLDLSDNLLSGSIPADIGNLSTLTFLNLATGPQGQMRADNLGWLLGLPSLTYLDMDGVDLSKASHNWLPIINTLHSLTVLSLYGCDLASLPSSFSHPNLTALTYLRLSYNGFNSTLPSWLWQLTSLSTLYLSNNHFYGTLPSAIGNLTRLGFLDLFDNLLSGPIPEEIGKLFNLESLDLSFNFFDGNISQAHFANVKKLDTLHLSKNFFLSITVDHNWLPPFHLQTIDLDSCKLSTSPKFPSWLRSQKSIILLNFSNTSIEDSLMPDHWFWISYSSTIQSIDLSYNKISGTLPRFMVNMTNLAFLNLSSNLFEGLVPPWPPQLQVLDLSNNFFSGLLPSTLESSQISSLILSNNHIEGSIPSSICNLNDIELVDLSNNNMTGKIPTQCWHVATLLKYIVLGNNKLSGRIPTSIGSLVNVRSLHLNNNSLYGHLPSQLQNCSFLSFIDFGENNLSGNIPAWMGTSFQNLTILRLCSNFFSGSIPLELGKLSTLQIIDLANNRLSGLLPYSFGSLSAVISVSKTSMEDAEYYYFSRTIHKINNYISLVTKGHQYNFSTLVLSLTKIIDLSDNSLTGTIPIEWGNLAGLQTLNLSRNNLMGKIPESIGEMRSLETLDLSFNKLEGVIPQGLAALNLLHHLNLSYNNFSGNIPTGNQLQTLYDASIYIGNTYLCGALLNKSCSNDTSIIVPVDTSLWLSIDLSAIIGFLVGLWSVFIILLFKKAWRYLYFGMIDKLYEKFYVALKKCMKAPNFR